MKLKLKIPKYPDGFIQLKATQIERLRKFTFVCVLIGARTGSDSMPNIFLLQRAGCDTTRSKPSLNIIAIRFIHWNSPSGLWSVIRNQSFLQTLSLVLTLTARCRFAEVDSGSHQEISRCWYRMSKNCNKCFVYSPKVFRVRFSNL